MIIAYIPTQSYKTKGEEFEVEKDLYLEYCDCYPEVDVLAELNKMRAWSLSNEPKRKTKRGMKRFINGWLSREQERQLSRRTTDLNNAMHPWLWKK